MSAPPVLLFDLGGVIVDFRGDEGLREVVKGAHSLDYCRANWWRLAEFDGLERGVLSPEDFADAFIREWRLDLDRAAFLYAFKHWVRGVFDDAPALLADLRTRHRLACLSNVNPAHWRRCVELGVDRMFDAHFLSHELGLRKPEPQIYEGAAMRLGVAAEDIIFFDDVMENVEAARRAGMRAEHVPAPSALVAALRRAGVI